MISTVANSTTEEYIAKLAECCHYKEKKKKASCQIVEVRETPEMEFYQNGVFFSNVVVAILIPQ